MLGFSYLPEQPLPYYPNKTFLVVVNEKMRLIERFGINLFLIFREKLKLADSVIHRPVLYLLVKESMSMYDKLRLNIFIKIKEKVMMCDKKIFNCLIKIFEKMHLKDKVASMRYVLVREYMTVKDSLRVNGELIVRLWNACLEKSQVIITNVYRKLAK